MLRAISRSIRHRLLLLNLVTTLIALIVACGAMVAYELHGDRKSWEDDLATQAQILGKASVAALKSDDRQAALENLGLLRARVTIDGAAIYTANGTMFAKYLRSPEPAAVPLPRLPSADGSQVDGNVVTVFHRIVDDNQILGTVYLRAQHQLLDRVTDYLRILALVVSFSLLVALGVSAWLQRTVTRPILDVSAVARAVMERRDFSLRAKKATQDEIGYLVDAFNEMLDEVERRANALRASNEQLQREMQERANAQDNLRTLNLELERRVHERTTELEAANKELESFSYSVSHDLRAPLRAVIGYGRMLEEDYGGRLDAEGRRLLNVVQSEAQRMGMLVDDLLAFSRLSRQSMQLSHVDMSQMAKSVFERLVDQHAGPRPQLHLGALPHVMCDRALIVQVWTNLLSNAIKFSSKREQPVIEVSAITDAREHVYFVRDNGAGFDPRFASKLFGVFQRLHDAAEFPGTGVGLALVQRIVVRHAGRVWAEGKPGEGATFYFALPKEAR